MTTPKLCVDCRWYLNGEVLDGCQKPLNMNLITGTKCISDCEWERYPKYGETKFICGREGRFWETKT